MNSFKPYFSKSKYYKKITHLLLSIDLSIVMISLLVRVPTSYHEYFPLRTLQRDLIVSLKCRDAKHSIMNSFLPDFSKIKNYKKIIYFRLILVFISTVIIQSFSYHYTMLSVFFFQHATPAVELQRPFFPTHLWPAELRSFHRPHLTKKKLHQKSGFQVCHSLFKRIKKRSKVSIQYQTVKSIYFPPY